MKKTSKILSAALALVMAFALAVPAFADGVEPVSLADSGCSYTVAPIGTVRVYVNGDDDAWEDWSVFDQAVTFTLKDGEFYYITGNEEFNRDASATLPANAAYEYTFMFESTRGTYYFVACTKSSLDKIIDDNGLVYGVYKMEYIPNNNSTTPTQPSAPAQPSAPSATVQKPAAGVSVPLNDGSGEFLYTLKSGDSLIKIAAYYYGKADVYKLIYERNKNTLKNADAVYAGQTIILPSYAAVAKGVASVAPAAPSAPTQPSTPGTTVQKPAPGVSVPLNDGSGEFLYTLKSGDSLIKIAAYYYGKTDVYKLIYERNRNTLKNADAVYAGQTIILPSYAAVAKGVAKI